MFICGRKRLRRSIDANNKKFWDTIKTLKRNKKKPIHGIRNIHKFEQIEEKRENGEEFNANVIWEITMQEVDESLMKIKIRKPGGIDMIEAELIKYVGKERLLRFTKCPRTPKVY